MRLPGAIEEAHKLVSPGMGDLCIMLARRKLNLQRVAAAVMAMRTAADLIENAAMDDYNNQIAD